MVTLRNGCVVCCQVHPLQVQDPFILDYNTAKNVTKVTAARVIHELKQAGAKCSSQHISRPAGQGKGWGLIYLFSGEDVPKLVKRKLKSCDLPVNQQQLVEIANSTGVIRYSELLTLWYDKVKELVLWVLSEVFQFKLLVYPQSSDKSSDTNPQTQNVRPSHHCKNAAETTPRKSCEGSQATNSNHSGLPNYVINMKCTTGHVLGRAGTVSECSARSQTPVLPLNTRGP